MCEMSACTVCAYCAIAITNGDFTPIDAAYTPEKAEQKYHAVVSGMNRLALVYHLGPCEHDADGLDDWRCSCCDYEQGPFCESYILTLYPRTKEDT